MPGTPHPARTATATVLVVLTALLIAPLTMSTVAAAAPAADRIWTPVAQRALTSGQPRTVSPTASRAYAVDAAALEAQADQGLVEVPDPQGRLVAFRVVETSVLGPELAAAHPEVRTWAGTAVEGTATIRLDRTPTGVHASVLGDGPSWYVDPAYRTEARTHLSYVGIDLPEPEQAFVEPELGERVRAEATGETAASVAGGPVSLRTYRLALLSDPTYAAAVAPNPTSEADSDRRVFLAKVTLVNRLDQIYGDDLGIRFVLADGTEQHLNLSTSAEAVGANGPCGQAACFQPAQLARCTLDTIARQKWVVGQLVGARSFDVGHLALGVGGGGLAYIGSVGLEQKAGGCTGIAPPVGDAYTVDFLAHELGHQLGADHTFDGVTAGCGGGNREAGTAVEPGSGSTVMAYAGTCGADDLQSHSDPVLSTVSIGEIEATASRGPWAVRETQSVALSGFDGTDSFRLSYGGVQSGVISRSGTYTAAGIEAAVRAALPSGSRVEVKPFFDEGALDARGFTLAYDSYGTSFYGDVPEPSVVPVSGSFTATANDITVGNLSTRQSGALTASGNTAPVVTVPAARTIPVRTPFELTASGNDADGDRLTYLWEQTDRSGSSTGRALTTEPKTAGPLFRVFGTASADFDNVPGRSATRSFPDLAQVPAGTTNADTGSCATKDVDCLSEWLPTASYAGSALHFRLTARDQSARGGGTASGDVTLTLDKTAGPLRVTSQATPGQTLVGGSSQTVTWAVNDTDRPALAPTVRVLLTTDDGATYTDLTGPTANDGSASVTLPRETTGSARLRVEAVGNYFYDVNDASFAIRTSGAPAPLVVDRSGLPARTQVQYSDAASATLSATSGQPLSMLTATATGLPAGLGLSAPQVSGGRVGWSLTGAVTAAPGVYPVSIVVSDGTTTAPAVTTTVEVSPEDATVAYTGPTYAEGPAWDSTSATVPLTASVSQAADGRLGALDRAVVRFTGNGATLCEAPVSALGTASCSVTVDLSGTGVAGLSVRPEVRGSFTGAGEAVTLTVGLPEPPDAPDPDTAITSGPTGWVTSGAATFGFSSPTPGATFICKLDNVKVPCSGGSVTLTDLAPRQHRFSVAAEDDEEETRDESPAVRDFAVPLDDTALKAAGTWKKKKSGKAYGGSYTRTRKKNAALTYQVANARELALLVRTGKRYGKVQVYLDKTLLATVKTSGKSGSKLVKLASFSAARGGTLRIVTTSSRMVAIDGLGVATEPF